jgi:HD-GYP domain-containing protein (c-di-GMP phosphodiesterase class II)
MQGLVEKTSSSKIDLLDKIWSTVKPEDKIDQIISGIISLTQNSIQPLASTLMLQGDNDKQELYFQFAEGPQAKQLKRLHIGRQSAISNWVIKNRRPMLVNNAEKNTNYYRLIDDATGFRTRAAIAAPIFSEGEIIGVVEALNKATGILFSKHDLDTITDVANTASIAIEGYRKNNSLLDCYKNTVRALVSLADAKETSGGGHSRRMVEYALMGARELGLGRKQLQSIEYAALFHDIGKLSIPDHVLNKTGKLTDREWALIKRHPVIGYKILKDIPFLKEAALLVLYHHERYDGGGYPEGKHGTEIPLGARLLAVVDAFDNMTTSHSYRQAMNPDDAFRELMSHTSDQFCPVAVKAFNTGFVRTRLTRSQRPV